MAGDTTQRDIGRLTAQVEALEKKVDEQAAMIREMRDVIVASRGSWKFLLGAAGLAATVSGFVVSASQWWPWR